MNGRCVLVVHSFFGVAHYLSFVREYGIDLVVLRENVYSLDIIGTDKILFAGDDALENGTNELKSLIRQWRKNGIIVESISPQVSA